MGCGEKAKFWEDGWKDDGVPLKAKYPTLFSVSKQQQHQKYKFIVNKTQYTAEDKDMIFQIYPKKCKH